MPFCHLLSLLKSLGIASEPVCNLESMKYPQVSFIWRRLSRLLPICSMFCTKGVDFVKMD